MRHFGVWIVFFVS